MLIGPLVTPWGRRASRSGPMPRWNVRPCPDRTLELATQTRACPTCGRPLWAANKPRRVVTTLDGLVLLRPQVRSCRTPDCPRHRVCLRPEQEGRFALPQHEFGLDVIALVGRPPPCRTSQAPGGPRRVDPPR